MPLDVVELRDFYSSPLGGVARRQLGRAIRFLWPNVSGMVVAGLGYATPYLGQFREEAVRNIALMPAQQGVVHWPRQGPFRAALVDELDLPLPDSSIDRLLLVHHLEMAEQLRPALREAWRVLAPGGRILIAVPNRRGIWARMETTPFGHGRPYSRSQLVELLREAMLTPVAWSGALFVPPVGWRFILRLARLWERMGRAVWPRFAGVILVEATKQIYAPAGRAERVRSRRPLAAPVPAAQPARTACRSGERPLP